MITSITPNQQEHLVTLMERWREYASTPTDHKQCEDVIARIYRVMGENCPRILHFSSPLLAIMASQLGSQLDSRLDSQLDSQLGSQLRSQLGSQLRSQLDSPLASPLRLKLASQIDNQLGSQLYSQLDYQLYSQLENQLRSQLRVQLRSQLDNHYIVVWWGFWACFFEFCESIGVAFDTKTLRLFTDFVRNIHTCIPLKGMFIYSDKPIACHWKGNNLHNERGKAVEYSDGWGWYVLNGVEMKEEYVMTPAEQLQPDIILKEKNVDVRRELLRKIGLERMVSYGKEIDTTGFYKLIDMSPLISNETYAPYLLMKNPSLEDTWHLEGVGQECKTIEDALHWYKPEAMRKIPISDDGENWYQQGDVCIYPEKALALKRYPIVLT